MNLSRCAALAAIILLPLLARAEISPIRVRVEQQGATDAAKFTTTQHKSLKVFLSNASKEDLAGLKVKYFYFGRDVKNREVKLLDKGEQPADVKALGMAVVETPETKAKSTESHTEGGNFNNPKKNAKIDYGKKVGASGEKFIGYGVQVFDASGKLLAESFEPQSMKQEAAAK